MGVSKTAVWECQEEARVRAWYFVSKVDRTSTSRASGGVVEDAKAFGAELRARLRGR